MRTAAFRYGAILATALMCGLYARVTLPWAALFCVLLVPWLAALSRERTLSAAMANGAAMSIAFTIAVFAWFANAVSRYTGVPLLAALALLIVAAPLLQPQFIVFAAVRHALTTCARSRATVTVAAACGWLSTEWLFPRLFGDTLGQGLHPFASLRQGADLAGVAGLTLVVLLVNECLYTAIAGWHRSTRDVAVGLTSAVALIGALGLYGAFRLQRTSPVVSSHPRRPLSATLVQANLDDYEGLRERLGTVGATRRILEVHATLSRQALEDEASESPVDLLVWPETVYPTTFGKPKSAAGARLDTEIERFVARAGVPLFFGTYDRDGDAEHNAAVLLQPAANGVPHRSVYRKRRLFPLTEEVPPWLEFPGLREHLPWLGTWRAGDGPPVLTLRRRDGSDLTVAPLICLDAVDPRLAFDAARRGADLLLTLSNDGWFSDGRGARLHLIVSAFRSVETGLPQLRATNTGITAFITATGDIAAHSNVGRRTALIGQVVPGRSGMTLATLWGDWLGPAATVAAFLLTAPALRSSTRHSVENAPPDARSSGAF